MKKTTLITILTLAFNSVLFAQYTSIPDVNFELALIAFGVDSEGTQDGQILTADAEAEVSLSVSNQGIMDFTGIGAFVNITDLNVSYNTGATSLDLTGLSLLETLNTEGCSSINSLTISGLTAITGLNLYGNDLSTLDVSTNTLLDNLNVRNNQLLVLDLSSNTALTSLNSKNNMLTSLDMRNGNNANVIFFDSDFNSSLTCIFVDDASAGYLSGWAIDANSNFVNDEVECSTLNIEDMNSSSFNIYPNPAKNNIKISSNIQSSSVEVYSITGKLVLVRNLEFGENSLDISALSSGVYLARFSHEEQSITKKLIVE